MKGNEVIVRLINLFLKGLSLLSKLLLIIMLSKSFSQDGFAYYSLFVSIGLYIVSFIGLEYHAFSNRELIASNNVDMVFSNYIAYTMFAVLISVIIVYFVFFLNFLPIDLFVYLVFFVIFEYISLEISRYLNFTNRQLLSSVIITIKTSLWIFPVFLLVYFKYLKIDLIFILKIWTIFMFIGTISGSFFVFYRTKHNFKIKLISIKWILIGITKSKNIFLAAQVAMVFTVIDRYALKYFGSLEDVAIYSLYFSIAYSILSAAEATIFVFYIPKLIKEKKHIVNMLLEYKSTLKIVVLFLCVTIPISYIIIHPILKFINNESYIDNINFYYLLLLFVSVKIISFVPHYVIYALGFDDVNMRIVIKSLAYFIFIITICYFSSIPMINTIILGLILVNIYQLVSKCFFVNKIGKYSCTS